ncbi:MAG: hypothetical protein JWN61_1571 [Pseudonocardiales bacterium]|nr:hypothetical protein [Pseudonocardiales bacterium]
MRAFGERFPDTGIGGRAELEVRDTGGSMSWSFTVTAAAADSVDACIASQQARSLEGPYTVRATAASNGAKPGIIVNLRDGAVASAAVGLDLARATVAAFGDFTWRIYVTCGDALCDSRRP